MIKYNSIFDSHAQIEGSETTLEEKYPDNFTICVLRLTIYEGLSPIILLFLKDKTLTFFSVNNL